MADYAARFWSKVEQTGDCWWWKGSLNIRSGYGQFQLNGTMARAHRVAYELVVGPIPPGLDLDHLCRNRSCVNPAHLEPVTRRINLLRGATIPAGYAARTTCKYGHPFGLRRHGSKVERYCPKCDAETHRLKRQQKRQHATQPTSPTE